MTDVPHTYPHGVPCWVDVESPDPEAAQQFYGGLFGWTFETVTPPGAPPYAMARLDGADVAGVGPGKAGWSTYIAVDDVDATAAAVRAAGGTVTAQPEDAGPGGRDASCLDPARVAFRLWQARKRLGAQVVNVPGSWNFSNLHAASPPLEFYGGLFGWRTLDVGGGSAMVQVPGYGEHLRTTVDPDILVRQADAPDGFADVVAGVAGPSADGVSRWNVSFAVADRDSSAAAAEQLGATVLASIDAYWTRTALVRDPGGAVFTLSQFTPPAEGTASS